jgi:acyl-CoA thioesterase
METIRKALEEKDAFAGHLGIELLELESGRARARMPLEPFHRNMYERIHGGAIFGVADYVFQAASNSHGIMAVAIQAGITFHRAPRSGCLYAEAREVTCTRRLATYDIRVTEEDGRLIASFQGTVYRMPENSGSA